MEVLLAVLAGYAIWQYSEFQKFSKSFSLKISKIGFDLPRSLNDSFKNIWLNVTITVNNPTELSQSLDKIILAASYNGKIVGSLETATVVQLKTGENIYILPVRLDTLKLFSSVAEAVTAIQSKQGVSLNLDGTAKLGSYTIPIKQTVKVI
jgi:hypothetical protein